MGPERRPWGRGLVLGGGVGKFGVNKAFPEEVLCELSAKVRAWERLEGSAQAEGTQGARPRGNRDLSLECDWGSGLVRTQEGKGVTLFLVATRGAVWGARVPGEDGRPGLRSWCRHFFRMLLGKDLTFLCA